LVVGLFIDRLCRNNATARRGANAAGTESSTPVADVAKGSTTPNTASKIVRPLGYSDEPSENVSVDLS